MKCDRFWVVIENGVRFLGRAISIPSERYANETLSLKKSYNLENTLN